MGIILVVAFLLAAVTSAGITARSVSPFVHGAGYVVGVLAGAASAVALSYVLWLTDAAVTAGGGTLVSSLGYGLLVSLVGSAAGTFFARRRQARGVRPVP